MTAPARGKALLVGDRCASIAGRPEDHVTTGAPWRVYACAHCARELWLSSTSLGIVTAQGLEIVPMCMECAGLLA